MPPRSILLRTLALTTVASAAAWVVINRRPLRTFTYSYLGTPVTITDPPNGPPMNQSMSASLTFLQRLPPNTKCEYKPESGTLRPLAWDVDLRASLRIQSNNEDFSDAFKNKPKELRPVPEIQEGSWLTTDQSGNIVAWSLQFNEKDSGKEIIASAQLSSTPNNYVAKGDGTSAHVFDFAEYGVGTWGSSLAGKWLSP